MKKSLLATTALIAGLTFTGATASAKTVDRPHYGFSVSTTKNYGPKIVNHTSHTKYYAMHTTGFDNELGWFVSEIPAHSSDKPLYDIYGPKHITKQFAFTVRILSAKQVRGMDYSTAYNPKGIKASAITMWNK